MTQEFRTSLDIGKRALQMCGVTYSNITVLGQNNKNAAAVNFVYDKMRQYELRRNIWRFATRRVPLRPLDTTTMEITAPAWDIAKTYVRGSMVLSDERLYLARADTPVNKVPADEPTYWTLYFGPLTVNAYDSTISYVAGELVYTPSTTAAVLYLSLISDNTDDPTAIADWDATVTYATGETVTGSDAVVYQSKVELNLNLDPAGAAHPTDWQTIPVTQPQQRMGQNWMRVSGATLTKALIIWPVGTGPRDQHSTRNIFRLPNGYLREAPQDPKAGIVAYLGAPTGLPLNDWEYEGDYLCATEPTLILYRFVADHADVRSMDRMFCEGLACRIALSVCEELTQSTEKIQGIGAQYKTFMGEARTVNGIETGPVQPPEDELITCRA